MDDNEKLRKLKVFIRNSNLDNNPNGDRLFVKSNTLNIPIHDSSKTIQMANVLKTINKALHEAPLTYKEEGDEITATFPKMDLVYKAEEDGALKLTFYPDNEEEFNYIFNLLVSLNFYQSTPKG